MPRQSRQKSESGIYHIMLRGINQQIIFEDEEDYLRFIETVQTYKTVSGYKLFAYCLMSNHVHLLLKVEKEDLDVIMKRIAGSYVYWYNWKYHRKGHLFQDRFKSEPVEDDEYFLTVLRYIHQNPIKAGIAKELDQYNFSSYKHYLSKKDFIIDNHFVFSILNDDEFIEFHKEENEDKCLDIEEQKYRLTDNEAKEIIKEVANCETTTELQFSELSIRDNYIRIFKTRGLSIRQISRLTGVKKSIVEKIQ